jgi:ribosomal protein S18 acetylase RimI-like enzyme
MKEVTSISISSRLRKLLAYATATDRINKEYKAYIQEANRKLYAWQEDGKLVGCIGISFINTYECEIKHIAVLPEERGKHIGRQMIQFVLHHHALKRITAETDIEAVDFYRKFGFTIISLGEKYPGVERFQCVYEKNN